MIPVYFQVCLLYDPRLQRAHRIRHRQFTDARWTDETQKTETAHVWFWPGRIAQERHGHQSTRFHECYWISKLFLWSSKETTEIYSLWLEPRQTISFSSNVQELRPINDDCNARNEVSSIPEGLAKVFPQLKNITAEKVDKGARIFFPVVFSLFNIVYWIYYTRDVVYLDFK